jgi:hypothetical protein
MRAGTFTFSVRAYAVNSVMIYRASDVSIVAVVPCVEYVFAPTGLTGEQAEGPVDNGSTTVRRMSREKWRAAVRSGTLRRLGAAGSKL